MRPRDGQSNIAKQSESNPADHAAWGDAADGAVEEAGDDFASMVKEQLRQVSAMQSEADQNVQKLLSGETEGLTEVFTAARKAEVAFSLLMEIRNKLLDAYSDIKNMRV